jgi:hypothetical protein
MRQNPRRQGHDGGRRQQRAAEHQPPRAPAAPTLPADRGRSDRFERIGPLGVGALGARAFGAGRLNGFRLGLVRAIGRLGSHRGWPRRRMSVTIRGGISRRLRRLHDYRVYSGRQLD